MRRIVLYTICFLSTVSVVLKAQNASQQPNVLFILVDDLGYKDVGFMGSHFYETPHLDRLAEKGIIFTQAYSNSAACSPSRSSIITGQFTCRTGITDWIGEKSGGVWRQHFNTKLLPAEYKHNLVPDKNTLPALMKSAGYKTFFAGKWHLGGVGYYPDSHGFDINKGGTEFGAPYSGYFSPYDNINLADGEKGENLTLRLAKETSHFIQDHHDQPFFAFLSFYAVHGPLQTTRERWKKYQVKANKGGLRNPGFELQDNQPYRLAQDNPVFAAMVETVDDAVGIVLEKLKALKLDDNTIIVFTSDNGGVVSGEHYSTNLSPLRGGKGTQWEGGIRVPLVIYDPRVAKKIDKTDVPVMGSDLLPTILQLANVKMGKDALIDGQSLVSVMSGKRLADRPLVWHYPHYAHHGGKPSSTIRKGDLKLIHYYEDATNALYNLSRDVSERLDVSKQHPKQVARLYAELDSILRASNARYPIANTQYDPEKEFERLRGIRYEFLPKLEAQRIFMLSDEYQPNADWWGSE